MQYKPTITLSRLVVTKDGDRVFDQAFHLGLNVIRGLNGSGKTTVADLIFFALGGETPQWRAEAALCDFVYAEVRINGQPVTLRRQIEDEKFRPMAVFWGGFEGSEGPQTEWQLYPYAGTSVKESFSQAVFRVAGIPEVKGKLAAKVTLHQVLRVVYVDQKTDYEQIFRADPFDPQLTREAVGDLLCGVYDERLYSAEIELAEKETERARLQAEMSAIRHLVGSETIPDLPWLGEQKAVHERERDEAYTRLRTPRKPTTATKVDLIASRRTLSAADLSAQNQIVRGLHTQITQAQVETVDRQQFLEALQARVRALDESQATKSALGSFSFSFCPACYAPLLSQDGVCNVCKNAKESRPGQNLLRLRQALEQQIRESESMQKKLLRDVEELKQQLRPAEDRQRTRQLEYDEISTVPQAAVDAESAEIHRRIGYLDRTIEDLERQSQLAARVSSISDRQATLAGEISKLSDEIVTRRAAQEQTKLDVSALIDKLAVELLRKDLPREAVFEQASNVHFDFGGNKMSVDGRSTFAASSNVYLKNSFHLALLQASTLREYMRYPRLAIFDNVEDKGMEPARSHNFQRIVREFSATSEVDHQIILFTSMMAPDFESEQELLIGPSYTHASKTLRVPAVTGTMLQAEA